MNPSSGRWRSASAWSLVRSRLPDERLIVGRQRRRRMMVGRVPDTIASGSRGRRPSGGHPTPRHTRSPLRDDHKRTLTFLIEHPGSDKPAVAEALGIDWSLAEHLLSELERMDLVERIHGYPQTWRPV